MTTILAFIGVFTLVVAVHELGHYAAAGPAANVVFAIGVLFLALTLVGETKSRAVVGGVLEGSAAAEAGFMEGDVILRMNGEDVEWFGDLATKVRRGGGDLVLFDVGRGREVLGLEATPRAREGGGGYVLGVSARASAEDVETVRYGFVEGLGLSGSRLWGALSASASHIWSAITKEEVDAQLAGPVGIAKMSGEAASGGFGALVGFVALLSLSLGVFNILPLPILDGGHILYATAEVVRGRPLGAGVQAMGMWFGIAALGSLMIWVTFKDVASFFAG